MSRPWTQHHSDGIAKVEWRMKQELQRRKIDFKWQERIILRSCVPEYQIKSHSLRTGERLPVYVPVFFDGDEVHKGQQLVRDEEINLMLDEMHMTPLRYRYHAPMPDYQFNDILRQLIEVSNKNHFEARY